MCSATWSVVLREIFCVPLCPHPQKTKPSPDNPKKSFYFFFGGGGENKENKKERRGENGRKGLIVKPFAIPDMKINGKWCKSVIFLAPA